MRNHFYNKLTSPLVSICSGYVFICIMSIFLYLSNFYKNSDFFTWGPPVTLMGTLIEDDKTYYVILTLFFIHQIINNWIYNVTYPWIINCVQDPKGKKAIYTKKTSMVIVNMFALYSELDVLLIISGVMSQISFFVVLILANLVSISFINWQYIKDKAEIPLFSSDDLV